MRFWQRSPSLGIAGAMLILAVPTVAVLAFTV